MGKTNYEYLNPLVIQRADPWIYKHTDGYYYFVASVPAYNRIEIRRAKTIQGLSFAPPRTVWRKHDTGEMSKLIWAPELHFIQGKWYVYFAATHTEEIIDGLFTHRMYVIENDSENPMNSNWVEKGQVKTNMETFSLDATTFEHRNELYYVWAQKDPAIKGNSNLYIAKMENPWTIKGEPVLISKPEYEWETRGFWVNEGPAILKKNGRIFLTFSASATDENYCMGLLTASEDADLLDSKSWIKSPEPVFKSDPENDQFGPGHNSFTVSEDGKEDILIYHCRDYTEIIGDPLYDPNRHTKAQVIHWNEDGTPVFGKPVPYSKL
ncbi:glycoside hydrolase family 43 protein [Mesobacillus foraminis]|uniref:GH43 family beta-xylosidase n=1 Tax=Mesobacillus foraminis TaxID=279826 RepID=A0A4R2BHL5_9BACI|nr:family 43 glycosylhydrolase [Mesobacillus foraminis]TCN25414.1 GH43 family beta-xylosidase [Mesobacillus foraminis]